MKEEEVKESHLIISQKAQKQSIWKETSSYINIDSLIKTFLPNTRCKITNEMRSFLIKLLGNKPVTSTLLYSGQ